MLLYYTFAICHLYCIFAYKIKTMVSENIRKIMRDKRMGISHMASLLSVSRQTVYYYLDQGDKNPVSQLKKIASVLGVPLSRIIGEEKEEDTMTCPNCGKRFRMEG